MHVFPSFSELMPIFIDENAARQFLVEKGVIKQERLCSCGEIVRLNIARGSYRCFLRSCRKENTMFVGSFFYRAKLKPNVVLHMAHLWLSGANSSTIANHLGLSSHAVADFTYFLRELVADSLDDIDLKIGGPGIVVEIDESKFGKRKYNRGHKVNGAWIVGGVERTESRKVFFISVPDRTEETLLKVIQEHVHPESIIHSDLWKGYANLESKLGMCHLTVNHSQEFVNQDSGCHTNTIEGTWYGVKRMIPIRNRVESRIDEHLLEFVWRRIHNENLWGSFINALSEVAYE